MKSFSLALCMLLVTLVMTGCASVSLVDSWKDAGGPAKRYQKLLVVGVAHKQQMRQVFEEVFAAEVRKKGLAAVPSYTVTGPEEKLSRESLEEAVRKSGADGVITTRLVNLKRDTEVHTGYVMTDRGLINPSFADPMLYPPYLFDYYNATISYATFVHQSADVTTKRVATLETNLFDAVTGRMVWAGTTSAVNPDGIITASDKLAEAVIKGMARDGLI